MDIKNDAKRMVEEFNSKDLPFTMEIVNIDGSNDEYIVARWKWMDASYFNGLDITNDIKEFAVYVKLDANKTYTWFDSKNEFETSVGLTGISAKGSSFYGKSWEYKKVIVLGKDNKIDKPGIASFELNTSSIHKPIEEWLDKNGYKRRAKTLSEHKTGFSNSMDPLLMTCIGGIFSFVGCGFVLAMILIAIDPEFNSDGDYMFYVIFSVLALVMLGLGIPILKIFLPKYKKEREEANKQ